MSIRDQLPYAASLAEYEKQAQALFDKVKSGDGDARLRFKWEHPRFRGKALSEVDPTTLTLDDARIVTAQEYAFDTWSELAEYVHGVQGDSSVARFESAVEAVIAGDIAALRALLQAHPELVSARSTRRHHCTLLHYLGANGVEGGRQQTPPNAVEVMKLLLDAGAEPDALADLYDNKCTTMSMLVSSCHPANAGLQGVLTETLLAYGAALVGPGTNWQSALMTALVFGYLDTAELLARRGAPIDTLAATAGLGRLDEATRLLPAADARDRHLALALAVQHGHVDVVKLLLDAGEDANRFNPEACHGHSTPLHQAVWSDQAEIVRLLVERGARLDIRDTLFDGTPLGWANYGGRTAIAQFLREAGAPS